MEIQKLKKKILQEELRRRKSNPERRRNLFLALGIVVIILLTAIGVNFYQSNLEQILERQFSQAESLLEKGEYDRAYDKFNSLYQNHPEFHRSPEALFMAGEILHLYLHREKEALLAYLLMERDFPGRQESYRAQYRIAEIYKYRLKDFDRALSAFQKLLDSGFADSPRIQYEIADTYFRQKNLEQARIEFESLVKNYPQSPLLPEALYRIGATFALEGNYAEAEYIYRKVAEDYPDNPFAREAQFGLVSVFERRGELQEALQLLKSLRDTYDKPEILENRIKQIRKRIEKKKKAI